MSERHWGWLASAGEPVEVLSVTDLWGRELAEVLESAARRADDLWTAAITDPDGFERRAGEFLAATRSEVGAAGRLGDLLDDPPAPRASRTMSSSLASQSPPRLGSPRRRTRPRHRPER